MIDAFERPGKRQRVGVFFIFSICYSYYLEWQVELMGRTKETSRPFLGICRVKRLSRGASV